MRPPSCSRGPRGNSRVKSMPPAFPKRPASKRRIILEEARLARPTGPFVQGSSRKIMERGFQKHAARSVLARVFQRAVDESARDTVLAEPRIDEEVFEYPRSAQMHRGVGFEELHESGWFAFDFGNVDRRRAVVQMRLREFTLSLRIGLLFVKHAVCVDEGQNVFQIARRCFADVYCAYGHSTAFAGIVRSTALRGNRYS